MTRGVLKAWKEAIIQATKILLVATAEERSHYGAMVDVVHKHTYVNVHVHVACICICKFVAPLESQYIHRVSVKVSRISVRIIEPDNYLLISPCMM